MKSMQKGSALIVLVVLLGVIATGVGTFFWMNMSNHNKAVRFEENINKRVNDSESILSNGTMALMDKVSIKDNYAEQFRENLLIVMQARTTQNDTNLLFNGVTEQNPELSDGLYRDISSYIEGMRRDFHLSRSRLQDTCADYRVALNSMVSGYFMKGNGFPKIDVDSQCKVISDARTSETFETGVQTPLL
ncbi:conserved hypothetical protein [Vibrio chagasii]|nr:conserved hypothetical protein [Vibrio chagasii]